MDLLRHLELFEAVAEEEHFGRAAQAVGMAQPPMSQAIRRLEKELGCTLFQRTPRGAELTDAGRRVLRESTRVRDGVERLRTAALSEARAPLELLVDPGCPQEWANRLVTASAEAGTDLRLRAFPTMDVVARIREHGGVGLVLAPVRTEGLRVATYSSTHPLPRRPSARSLQTYVLRGCSAPSRPRSACASSRSCAPVVSRVPW